MGCDGEEHSGPVASRCCAPAGPEARWREAALFQQYKETRDPALRERLILMHQRLAISLARRFVNRGQPLEDLVQVAMVGLIHAVDRFDPGRDVKFVTFATPTILGELRRYFRDSSWGLKVPRRLQELGFAVRKLSDRLSQELGRSPTAVEIASRLGVSEEDVLEALELGAAAFEMVSLEMPLSPRGEAEEVLVADTLPATQDSFEQFFLSYRLKEAIQRLDPRERQVIGWKFLHGLSQTEIAERLDCSQMQVSRIQRRALERLRALMEE